MCTLILGRDIVAPGTTLLAANRDEDPARPSEAPRVLRDHPRVAGGCDRRAGGTWLAVRDDAAVAMLNRRVTAPPRVPDRSRGLLALDVARVPYRGAELASAALEHALDGVHSASYAPFSLVFAMADRAWVLAWDGTARIFEVAPGWHVLTHAELDDPDEPRTRRLRGELATFQPRSRADAERELIARLAAHDEPRVCIHDARMATVSFALVSLSHDGVRYSHGEGRPCEATAEDFTPLLEADTR